MRSTADKQSKFQGRAGEAKEARVKRYPLRPFFLFLSFFLLPSFWADRLFCSSLIDNILSYENGGQSGPLNSPAWSQVSLLSTSLPMFSVVS